MRKSDLVKLRNVREIAEKIQPLLGWDIITLGNFTSFYHFGDKCWRLFFVEKTSIDPFNMNRIQNHISLYCENAPPELKIGQKYYLLAHKLFCKTYLKEKEI